MPEPASNQPPMLPILDRRAEIVDAISRYQVVVVAGETGSGKTTQLPQFCLDMGRGRAGLIGHTQPRRLAARAVAARIAEERGVRLGGLVGAKVRFQDQTSRETVIKVLTDGMLLAELVGDPQLRAYGTLIVDEAHERSLNIDFLLGYLRRLLPRRPDLKLIITSATIDTERFSRAFGGPTSAPIIEVSGRMYPVEMRYRPPRDDEDDTEVEFEAVADAVEELSRPSLPRGDVLVFLPGEREIRLADNAVRRRSLDADILPLFSRLTNQEQDRIFHPGPRRRVILATNVAETSLTVPGIRYVVDTGLARQSRYDPQRKVQGLPIEPISRASASQRSGRCGRVADGICIRLYSEASFESRPAFTEPEIRRTSLAGVILRMKSLKLGSIEQFPFLDPPEAAAIRDGYETLFELGAISEPTSDAPLTAIGAGMSQIPVDPRIARMLLAADREGSLDAVIILAAALEIQDPRQRPMGRQEESDRAQAVFRHPTSDFLTLLKIHDQYRHGAEHMTSGPLASWCHQHFLSPNRMREWDEMIRQLRRVAEEIGLRPADRPASDDAIHRALLTGLITNVACREGDGSFDYRGVRGNSVQIFPGSVLFKTGPKWIMAAEVVHTTRLYARTVAKVDPAWIEELAGHMFRRQLSDHHLDAETGEPSAWERVSMSGIVVVPRRRTSIARTHPDAARDLFIRDGIVRGRWHGSADLSFMRDNRAILESARSAEAKLRRRNIVADEDALVTWFASRVPEHVRDPASMKEWLAQCKPADLTRVRLTLHDVLKPEAAVAADTTTFPDHLVLGAGNEHLTVPLEYALAPGKDEDGVTVTVPLTALPLLNVARAEWLVPGQLPELVQALIKILPKSARTALESKAPAARMATELSGILPFAQGSLAAALSEAAEVLFDVKITPEMWNLAGVPSHLQLRVRIIDDHGKEIAVGRDLADLHERLTGRIRRARAAQARVRFQRDGLTTWDFGDLPDEIPADDQGGSAYPALIDQIDSVSLTFLESPRLAALETNLGIRRLFALACRDELDHHLTALPQWSDMTRQFAQLGTTEELRADLACIIAERAFMTGQAPLRTQSQFEERKAECWGRLSTIAREVGESVARILEPRSRIAHRFAGGTPRLWASSVADIREHAAYLMPRGFLRLVPWERLRHYPRYVECMRNRLFALREEGSGAETVALAKIAPHWKRFTGWVAAAMSAERTAAAALAETTNSADKPRDTKAPLPKARRAAPVVNLDAGEWAMQPGRLPPPLEHYRWALEEFRASLLASETGTGAKSAVSSGDLDTLWKRVQAESLAPPAR